MPHCPLPHAPARATLPHATPPPHAPREDRLDPRRPQDRFAECATLTQLATQLALWLLALAASGLALGAGYYGIACLLTGFYLVSLCSIVRHHNRSVRSALAADQQSRATQGALATREAELRAIFENAAVGLVVFDPVARRIVQVNPEYCRITARNELALLGSQFPPEVAHPGDWEADRHWDAPSQIGNTTHHDKRLLQPDGTAIWVRVSSRVLAVGADGCPHRILAIMHDCTEQKTAEAALRASEEMLRLSLGIGRIGSFHRDHRTRMIRCGLEMRLMHGLPPDDRPIPFAVWGAMVFPEDMAVLSRAMVVAHASREPTIESEYRFLHPIDGLRHVETRSRTTYDEDGIPLHSVGVIIDVTERRQAEARIAHLAHHDPLTALPNRALFRTRLDEALDRAHGGKSFALLCLDLDHFKEVNDTLGHPTGDALLRAVTERLTAMIRPADTVARIGGDEFALIQSDLQRPEDPLTLAERVIAALQTPFDLDGQHVVIGTTIGIVIAPDDGMDAQTLLRRVDVALYAAKGDGRGGHRRFETHMDADMQTRRTLELDLRHALKHQEFELFYQPIVDVTLRTVCGFEALLRWHHPSRGLVSPERFIPLAEATGLLVPIGAWVLHQACAEAGEWTHGARISVNLSAVQLAGDALVATVTDALRCSGLDPRRLELELTETAVLEDTEATLATLHRLKALGVTIALDDFGTGYSSLGYLQRFPFDKVKIDRSFTSHLADTRESAAIVRAVIDLCSSLDMRTTAEGVETLEQFEALAKVGCAEVQGYYFSPPLPAAAIPATLAQINELFRRHPAIEGADFRRAGASALSGAAAQCALPVIQARLCPIAHD
jgi:diguanylate cyclase (GGDEF)-like protein/PAS domain S-box-containing protein